MFDSRKIDAFFDGEKQLKWQIEDNKPHISRWARFVKLGFPCIAALLFGLMVIMPNIKKSADLRDNITLPRKSELEKLHMEETVFSSVDNQNRVNKVVADSVDEVEPGSQKVKFINPNGEIPTDDGTIKIVSEYGYFTQNDNILELYEKVHAVINDDTTVDTVEAVYDFNSEFGYGKKPIKAVGSWGTLTAPEFTYDKKNDLLTLVGDNVITTQRGILTAQKETRFYQKENKVVSEGNAVLKQDSKVIRADKVTSYFSDTAHKELKQVTACGHVMIDTMNETAHGAYGYYDVQNGKIKLFSSNAECDFTSPQVSIKQGDNLLSANHIIAYMSVGAKKELQRVEAFGDVVVTTQKGSAKGKRGVYDPQKNIVELFDDVHIEQNGNFIDGAHAETNLNTSVSRIKGDEKTGGRISGIFYKKGKQKNEGNETK